MSCIVYLYHLRFLLGPPRQNQYRPRRPPINPVYKYVAPDVVSCISVTRQTIFYNY
jgi:hypothetical protein